MTTALYRVAAPVLDDLDVGVWIRDSDGHLMMGADLATSLGVVAWVVMVVLGLLTTWLVMP